MATILSGTAVANARSEALFARATELKKSGIVPKLAIVRLGERAEDLSYERGACKRCEKIGILVQKYILPQDAAQDTVLSAIEAINRDRTIHSALLFQPFPAQICGESVLAALDPAKDADGITDSAKAHVFSGHGIGFPPCTAQACMELLHHYGYDLTGKRAVVIGRSMVIGRPVAMLLLQENATVTICHTRTEDMPALCRSADILVAAAGRANMVDSSYVNAHQVVLDVGINIGADGTLVGDVDFAQVEPRVAAITPVPGGVGAVTSTVLAAHVVEAAEGMA
ncbi:MAG: bifunctional 5,10-methylene-tetrahydrofolate dehydrogenase/5,10-methylene-tetrahydrofolate cyclohydrolase [Oscillospiraceae bacterium]|nr:bifunctional 5,10-methylene-tetrahydrofolate dehydrogenase/5,10-methylene-tetrahydrofolate cyclohydrolase [Oscillospiraceae bacterium]